MITPPRKPKADWLNMKLADTPSGVSIADWQTNRSDDLVMFLGRLIDEKVILPETADLLKMLHDRDEARNIQKAEIALLDRLKADDKLNDLELKDK